ncbi:MAG: filamentous hemagglutinin N-terminal domain-containing protein [Alphaproteobacteria bacterium]|nr:filamentous hemagglutinin N-terminal domain-containing protein [Alphaproteobacteria bacterium]MBL7099985.1 filamentous hemagglutinin N-terminal domain-containing protein [Alphaproteobacteria bacterium]
MSRTSATILRAILLGTSCLSAIGQLPARAQPVGGQVVLGSATITNPNPNSTIIDQKTGKAVINWNSFSIGAGGSVQFNQPNASAIALNRVLGGEASSFYGKLLANGQVWIINQNGILFGQGATFNVGGILATTADISDTDFAAGNYRFSGGTGASVVNQGTIRAKNGGVVLSGASVQNQGLIEADAGTVVLGGASAFTVDFVGDGLIKYAITQPAQKADNGQPGVSNSGTINAPGGRVVMTARAAADVQDAVVNNTGMISATSARVQNGEVILDAGDGDVADSGAIDASGAARGQTGGSVAITGRNIAVADGARIDVSGDSGGGTVRIGGDMHGQGPFQNAANTHIGRAAITANATRSGNGGSLVVWSNGITDFSALFSARGGTLSGNGGFLETSGHDLHVGDDAKVDTTAPNGQTGLWLLDPKNIGIVSSGGGASLDVNGTLAVGTDAGADDTINASTITGQLGTTDVMLQASNDINIGADVIYSSTHNLSLLAGHNINASASVQNAGTGGVYLVGGWNLTETNPANFTAAGVYGNNSGVVSVIANAANVFIGSAGGPTVLAGSRVVISGQGSFAQVGYHGAGGGSIAVYALHDVVLENRTSAAMLGNGSVTDAIAGEITGDVAIHANQGAGAIDGYLAMTTTGGAVYLGNRATAGHTASGNLLLTAYGALGATSLTTSVATDILQGDVFVGTNQGYTPTSNLDYASAHTLSIASRTDLVVGNDIQNSGTGAINLIAGWDGITTILANLTNAGVYGNGGGFIENSGSVAIGGAGGTTTLAADSITLGTYGSAQIGYYGIGGGSINVLTKHDLNASMHSGGTVQIGNGDGVTAGSVTGNIGITVGGNLNLNETSGSVILGNRAAGGSTETGNLTVVAGTLSQTGTPLSDSIHAALAGGDVLLNITGSDLSVASAIGASYSSAHNLTLESGATLTVDAAVTNTGSGSVTLGGNSITAGGSGAVTASTVTLNSVTGIGFNNSGNNIVAGTLNITASDTVSLLGSGNAFGTLSIVNASAATITDTAAVEIDGATVTGTLALTSTGAITQGTGAANAISATTLNVSTSGAITLANAGNAFGTLSIVNASAATITDRGAVEIDGASVSNGFSLTTTGDIAQGSGNANHITAAGLTLSTSGGITLGNAGNAFGTLSIVNGTAATITDTGAVELDGATVTGTLALTSTGTITQGSGAANAISATTLNVSTSGAITLGNAANAFSALTIGNGASAVIQDTGAVEVDGVTVTGTFALTTTAAITQGAGAGRAISATTLNVSTSGAITLDNPANAFTNLTIGNGSAATIRDTGAVEIDGVAVAGTLALTTTGAITQSAGAGNAISATTLNVSTSGAITLDNPANAFTNLMVGNGSAATIRDTSTVEIDGVAVAGTLALTTTGAITQGAGAGNAISAAILNVSAGGSITLDNAANAFGTLTIDNASTARIRDSVAIEIDGVSVAGALALTTTGAVTQGAGAGNAIRAALLNVSTSGAITLGNAANAFGQLTIGGATDAVIADTGDVSGNVKVDGVVADTLTLSGSTRVSQGAGGSDFISARLLTVSASGSITLNNAGNAFGKLAIGGGTDATIVDAGGHAGNLEIDGAAVTGTLTISGSATVSQGTGGTDFISAGALAVSATGAITLSNAANAFGYLTIGNGTDATIVDTGDLAGNLEIDGAAVSATLNVSGSTTISQGAGFTDLISANTLTVSAASSIVLDNPGNTLGKLTVGSTNALIVDTGDLAGNVEIDGATVSGQFILFGSDTITQGAGGTNAISAGLVAVAAAGAITLGNTANAFGHLSIGGGTDATIVDAGDHTGRLKIYGATVSGTLTISGSTTISQGAGNTDFISADTLNLSASGAITLNNAANSFSHLIIGSAASASLKDTAPLEIDGVTVTGALMLANTASIGQGSSAGDLISAGSVNVSSAGTITLNNTDNTFGKLAIGAGTDSVIVDTGDVSGNVEIDGVVTGTLTLSGSTTISQGAGVSDFISANMLTASASGAITLDNVANSFARLKIGGGTGATIVDTGNLEIDGATVSGTFAMSGVSAISEGSSGTDYISASLVNLSASGAIALGNAANAFGHLSVGGGSGATIVDTGKLEIDGVTVTGTLAVSGVNTLSQGAGGANSITAGLVNVSASGAITLDNAANAFGHLTIGGGAGATIVDTGNLEIDRATVTGTLAVSGANTLSQGSGGANSISAGLVNVSASGAITLTNAANTFGKLTISGGAGATIVDKGDLAGNLEIDGATVTGTLAVSGSSTITQGTGGTNLISAGLLNVSATGAITLDNASNAFAHLTIGSGTGATLKDTGPLEIDGATVTGTLALTGGGAISQGAGNAISAGSLSISTAGTITLGNTANTFGKVTVGGGSAATLYDSSGVEVDGATVAGALALTSGGAITQGSSAGDAISSAALNVSVTGAINLANTANAFGKLTINGAPSATLFDSTGVEVDGVGLTGALTLTSLGSISQGSVGADAISAAGVNLSAGGAITLGNASNAFGALTIANGAGATIADTGSLEIDGATVSGTLAASSGGSITQGTGAADFISASALNVSANGAISFGNTANVFGKLTIGGGTSASLFDHSGVEIDGVAVTGTLTLTGNGAISEGAGAGNAIQASGLNLTTSSGAITLNNAGNAFATLTVLTHGSDNVSFVDSTGVTIAGATVGGTLSISAGGAIGQSAAVHAAALNLTSGGAITLTDHGNVFGTLSIGGATNAMLYDGGAVEIDGTAVTNTLGLTSTGAISQGSAAGDAIATHTLIVSAGGAIMLGHAGNTFDLLTIGTGTDASLHDAKAVEIDGVALTGTFSLNSAGAMSQGGTAGDAIVAAALNLSTVSGSIDLENSGNVFGTLTVLTHGSDDARLVDDPGLIVASATVGGTLLLVADGAITQSGAIQAAALDVSTTGGAITLTNAGNVFGTLTALTHGADNASFVDSTGVTVASATVGGTLNLATGGAVSQTGAIQAAALNVSTSSGAITLTKASNAFGTLTLATRGADGATITDSTGVSFTGATVGGTLTLAAGGAVSQTGAINAPLLNISTVSGAITLTNAGNVFGTLTLLTHGSDNATLTDSAGVSIAGATVGGTLTLATRGAVSQIGAISASELNVSTASGAITLTNSANAFGTLTLLTHGTDSATITDSSAVTIAGASVGGTFTLAAGGAISQTGAVQTAALNVSTSSGAITLTSTGNTFATLTALTHASDNATFTVSTGVTVAGATVGGTLALSTGGAVTQTGAIATSVLSVSTSTGAVTLTNAGNTFGTLALLTHGTDNAMITDLTGVSFSGATVGGTLKLAAGGAVTQTGAVQSSALDVLTTTGAITLTNGGNVFSALTLLAHGSDSATITDSTGVSIAGATVGGTLALAAGGAVTQSGAIQAAALNVSTSTGSITLNNAGNAFGTLTLLMHGSDDASLTDSTGVSIASAVAGGKLTLVTGGAVTQTGTIQAAALNVATSTGAITLTNAANAFGTLALLTHGSDNVTITDSTGVSMAGATVGGTLTLSAGGAVTQTGAIQAAALNVSTSTGAITLTNAANAFGTLTLLTHGTDSATITDSSAMTIASASVGGTFTLAAGGAISQTGAIQTAAINISTTSGAITLTNAGNAFATLTTLTHGTANASFSDSTGVNIAGATVGGTLALVAGGPVTQSGAIKAAALNVATSTGAITLASAGNEFAALTVQTHGSDNATFTDSAGVTVAGATVAGTLALVAGGAVGQTGAINAAALNISTTSGGITLTNAANVFGTLTALTHGADNASFVDSTGVTVASATVGGTLNLATGGAVSQTGAIQAAALNVSTSNGAMTLTNAANAFGTLTLLTHGTDSATVTDSSAVTVASASGGGTFTLAAGGAISQTGAIQTAALNIATTSGAITLTNAGNAFGTLNLLTHGADSATITDSTGVSIAGAVVGGTLALVAGGAVRQTGAINAAALSISTTSGAITLTNAANVFGTLTALTHGADNASFVDSTGVTVASATVGGKLTLATDGAVSQTGAIQAAALNVSTGNGAITLTNAGNVFGTLTLLTHGTDSVTMADSTGVSFAGTTVGGTLTLAAGGAVTQSGAIQAAALNVSTSTSGITLTNAGNVFSTLTLLTHGSDNVTLTDSTGVSIAGATVGGTLALATGGAVTQSGAINASALSVLTSSGAITLTNPGNVFSTLTLLTHGSDNATITGSTGVSVASATVGGTLTLATGGAVTQSGAIQAAALNVSTSTGAVTLTNAANAFGTLTLLTHGSDNATLTDSTGVSFAGATVGGTLTLAAGGAVSETGAIQAAALNVSTSTGGITLTNAGNVFSMLTLLTQGSDNAMITDSTGVSVASATVGGTLTLTTGGAVTQSGAINASALNVSTSSGAITLNNGSNVFETLTLLTHGSDDASLTDSTGVSIASAIVGGKLTLVTGGAVSQTGAIQAAALNVSTSTGAITLTNATNVFGALTLLTHSSDSATITDSTAMSITGATVGGTLTLAAGGAVSQTGAIQAAALNVSTSSGAITLTNAANAFGTLTLLTHGTDSATLADSIDLTVASAAVGANLTLLSAGNIGVVTAVQSTTGAINLVAGWDKHTLAPANFGTAGVFGNNGKGVTIGGAGAAGNASLGTASGTTSIYGASLTVAAVHGYAQIGAHGNGSGAVLVNVTGNVSVAGGAGNGQFAQIGNGGLLTTGNNSGDITITAGGNLVMTGGTGSESFVQIGQGGAESNNDTSGYSNTGVVTISAVNLVLTGGTGTASYAQIGEGGYRVGNGLSGGLGDNIGTITVNASGTVLPTWHDLWR